MDHYQATTHTFADHVHRELDEISADLSKHKSYAELFANRKRYPVLLRSLYALQLEPWLDVFDRSQLYVVQSEDLYEKPHVVMQGVNRFLELAENTLQDYPAYNVTKGKREINDTIIKDLESFFEPYNKQLNLLLGQSFSW